MLSVVVGAGLMLGGALILLAVFRPDAFRAYFHRPRHTARAVQRRRHREEDPFWQQEEWFREWRKQYPALLEETREVRVLSGR